MQSVFKDNILRDQVAVITGGSSGIGLKIAEELLRHGMRGVIITGRRQKFLDSACSRLNEIGKQATNTSNSPNPTQQWAIGCAGDVRKPEDCKRAVDLAVASFGRLDLLVCSAAGNFLANADELSPKGFATVMGIDTLGTFNACWAARPHLQATAQKFKKQSSIIMISATLHYGATWYQLHPSAAKAANDALTRNLALEWGSQGIQVNAVAPGPIADTAGMTKLSGGANSEALKAFTSRIPLGRMGTKSDVAQAILYLTSPAGQWVSGHMLVVDGGAWLYKDPPFPREMISHLSRKVERKSRSVQGVDSNKKSKL
eukprot:g530.t1